MQEDEKWIPVFNFIAALRVSLSPEYKSFFF